MKLRLPLAALLLATAGIAVAHQAAPPAPAGPAASAPSSISWSRFGPEPAWVRAGGRGNAAEPPHFVGDLLDLA